MNILKRVGAYAIVALMLLGIGYKFILPFTPVWFDLLAWSAIAIAFLIALATSQRKNATAKDPESK